MNLPEHAESSSGPAAARVCPERHALLDRLKPALDGYSAVVRESREHGQPQDERTETARSLCAQAWDELREHQEKHKCWRQHQDARQGRRK